MTRQDVESLMASLPGTLRFLRDGMAARLDEAFRHVQNPRAFSFGVSASQMTPAVYDAFRDSAWLLLSVPEQRLGEGVERASLWVKQYAEHAPLVCFHATPAANREGIERLGILPGYRLGKKGRGKMFADSRYYIYGSLNANAAADWCLRFAEAGKYLIYPVRLDRGPTPVRLFTDPMSENTETGEVCGHILETTEVPRDWLGPPLEIEVGSGT
jgi:hypothetical protein